MYKIEKKLKEIRGGKAEMYRQLNITHNGLNKTLKSKKLNLSTMKRYTNAFNDLFETNYSYKELFE